MFGYTISIETNENRFYEICKILEVRLNMSTENKEKMLEDVDGTIIQTYWVLDKKIKVINDYEVDAVYIDSEIDLSKIITDYIIHEYKK